MKIEENSIILDDFCYHSVRYSNFYNSLWRFYIFSSRLCIFYSRSALYLAALFLPISDLQVPGTFKYRRSPRLSLTTLTQYILYGTRVRYTQAVKLFRTSRVTRVATTRERSFPSVDKYIQGQPLAQPSVSSGGGRVAHLPVAASPVLTRRLSIDCSVPDENRSRFIHYSRSQEIQCRYIRTVRTNARNNDDSAPIKILRITKRFAVRCATDNRIVKLMR